MSVLIYFKDREKVSIRNKDSSILLYILKIVRRQLYKYWLRPEVCKVITNKWRLQLNRLMAILEVMKRLF